MKFDIRKILSYKWCNGLTVIPFLSVIFLVGANWHEQSIPDYILLPGMLIFSILGSIGYFSFLYWKFYYWRQYSFLSKVLNIIKGMIYSLLALVIMILIFNLSTFVAD